MSTISEKTELLDSINIILANLGESPVDSLSASSNPPQVELALNTIKEVNKDVQSKGWWFNQTSGGTSATAYSVTANITIHEPSNTDWQASIPEEARRYITIRAARILQSRLIGSEELSKFSYQEELVSLAILQQAHVRYSDGVLDFNNFPAELKGLGIDEFMFLQGTVEDKLGTLRLTIELANAAKIKAETALIGEQEDLVVQQELTEKEETQRKNKETALLGVQKTKIEEETDLLEQQFLTEQQETAKRNKEVTILEKQATKIDEEIDMLQQQFLTEEFETLKRNNEKHLVFLQQEHLKQQTLTETQETAKRNREISVLEVQKTKIEEEIDMLQQQFLTEQQETAKRNKEVTLLEAQKLKIDEEIDMLQQQFLSEQQETARKNREVTVLEKQATKIDEETDLLQSQDTLVIQQELTEKQETTKRTREHELLDAQETKVQEEIDLLQTQDKKLTDEHAIGAEAEKAFYVGVKAGTQDTYRDFGAEMRMMGIQETAFQALPAYKKIELIKDATKLRANRIISGSTIKSEPLNSVEITEVNSILRLIGEQRVSALTQNALASEAILLLRDTSRELQGRGLWFNTELDTEFTPDASTNKIALNANVLSVEPNDKTIKVYLPTDTTGGVDRFLYNLKDKGETFSSAFKAKVIYERGLDEIPHKFLEYAAVRTAMLLTELYPQSGIDVQRLQKLEKEAEAYFRDREFDEANYTVFDNYDVVSRIGINRNYQLL